MLSISRDSIFTPRLELRRTRVEDAAAMFEALRNPEMYAYIPRAAPASAADVITRFRRITQETAPDREDQWLNWTVWLRDGGVPLGMTEATITPAHVAIIGYMFDPRCWRRGYGAEAVSAMLEVLAAAGASGFEASIDIRNQASRALAAKLGFKLVETAGIDETWRRQSG